MFRTIYLSAATGPIDQQTLTEILAVSHRNNARDDVTGLLAYHERNFLQVLEGPQAAVTACLERISLDERHTNVLTIASGPVADRLFPNWKMGLADPRQMEGQPQTVLTAFDGLNAEMARIEAGDRRAAIMLRTFMASFRDLRPARSA